MISRRRLQFRYVVADFLSTVLAVLLFEICRYYIMTAIGVDFSLRQYITEPSVIATQIGFPLLMLAIYYTSGYYAEVFFKSRMQEMLSTFSSAVIGSLFMTLIVLINDMTPDRRSDYALICIFFSLLFVIVYIPRSIITTKIAHKIRRGEIFFNTLIIGHGSHPDLFKKQYQSITRSSGRKIVGLVDIESTSPQAIEGIDVPVYDFNQIERICTDLDIKSLIVISHPSDIHATMGIIKQALSLNIPIFISPDSIHMLSLRSRSVDIAAEPLIDISRPDLPHSTIIFKRLFDVVVSSLALIVLIIPLTILCLLIMIDSKGSPFFKQRRMGFHRKPFYIYKLRTMYRNAEASGPRLSHDGDPRVTRIGYFLRKYRLDELPQFFNVLRGDMSIVGPRPEREYFISQITEIAPHYILLHQLRPGITSWGMVKYGYASNVDQMVERLRYDFMYLQNMSLLVDMKIIFYTVETVVTGKGI